MSAINVSSQSPLKTVLYVDDEPLSQKYFKASISPFAEVLTASTPVEARKILEVRGDSIAVIVSDERMPCESGIPFLTDVRFGWPAARRVLTSAYADCENLQQAINDAQICYFVPKPWNLDQLCSAVKNALMSDEPIKEVQFPSFKLMPEEALNEIIGRLEEPIQAIETDAMQIMVISGGNGLNTSVPGISQTSSWSVARRLNQMSSAAARVHRAASVCQSMLEGIRATIAGKPERLQ